MSSLFWKMVPLLKLGGRNGLSVPTVLGFRYAVPLAALFTVSMLRKRSAARHSSEASPSARAAPSAPIVPRSSVLSDLRIGRLRPSAKLLCKGGHGKCLLPDATQPDSAEISPASLPDSVQTPSDLARFCLICIRLRRLELLTLSACAACLYSFNMPIRWIFVYLVAFACFLFV